MKRLIEVTPQFFETFFRKGFKGRLISKEVLNELKLRTYGFDSKKDLFYFIFSSDDDIEGSIPEADSPVYTTNNLLYLIVKEK
ncbi:MAG: hypothetical protein AABY22_30875 [Nanoarchaeota archaeon]